MITFRQLTTALQRLEIERSSPVIAHVSLSSFGEVQGGTETVLGALLSICSGLMMPTFTYKTMIIPEVGPEGNGITYGSGKDSNQMAEFYTPEMPADRLMGAVAESLRRHPRARRSMHPILSFAGINVEEALAAQTLDEPLRPIEALAEQDGYVLLAGVDHTVNTSIHYAEKLAGRRQFLRWSLSPQGVTPCPGFPGASDGFEQIEPYIEAFTRQVTVGGARIRAVPLPVLLDTARTLIEEDPRALLKLDSTDERTRALLEEGD